MSEEKSNTVESVQQYLAIHKRNRSRLRRELVEVEQQIKTCEEWIEELKAKKGEEGATP